MALIMLAGTNCLAEGFVDGSIVGGLADSGDLEPLPESGGEQAQKAGAIESGVAASVRQSVPTRDRAASYRATEVFRNSKTAVPLLVADLEPRVIVVSQPMSGRSVGARPAAAWTRVSPAEIGVPAAWASHGR